MKSIDLFPEECITVLQENKLIKPLIKGELIKELLSKIALSKEEEENALQRFIKKLGITDSKALEKWITTNKLTESDLQERANKEFRLTKYCITNFSHKAESRFIERKEELDIVVYSLIRVKDIFKAKEFYLRIIEGESDFGDLATLYSEGLENRTRGIIGPIPLKQAHPRLVTLLTNSKPGVTQPPIEIQGSHLVVRVESYDSAQFDSFMKEKMVLELFDKWIEAEVSNISDNFLLKNEIKNKGVAK
ncbi:peptidylprolyl isomerase [Prochlorococcus marinus]|uniref:peptidylprolyl isomerase n=1 Tax=Prochlorococcus marinus TaxID=1219 RepID=UPI0022B2DD07|nr:peptidylprolyl isomerase [Prochlorococcus marinus]